VGGRPLRPLARQGSRRTGAAGTAHARGAPGVGRGVTAHGRGRNRSVARPRPRPERHELPRPPGDGPGDRAVLTAAPCHFHLFAPVATWTPRSRTFLNRSGPFCGSGSTAAIMTAPETACGVQ